MRGLIEDQDLRHQLASEVNAFIEEHRATRPIDPRDPDNLAWYAGHAAEAFCNSLSPEQRKKLLKPLGYYIDPLKPYSVYPGRLVDEKFGPGVIAQLLRLAQDGDQFVALARKQTSHAHLGDKLRAVVKATQNMPGGVAFVSAYTPRLKLLAFLGAADGATPSYWATGTNEIMEAKGLLALNVTTENRKNGKINMAYGFLGDNKEPVPVYELRGEGALAVSYAKPAMVKDGQLHFEGARDFDVVLSPGNGEDNPKEFIDAVMKVQDDYNQDLSRDYDETTIDDLNLMRPVINHIAGEPVGSAWVTAAETLMYIDEKITAYDEAKQKIAALVQDFAAKVDEEFKTDHDKIAGLEEIKNRGIHDGNGMVDYHFNTKSIRTYDAPSGRTPYSKGFDDFFGLIKAISYGGDYHGQHFPGQINALFDHLNHGGFRQRFTEIFGEQLFGDMAEWIKQLEADNKMFGQREKFDLFMNLMKQVEARMNGIYQQAVEKAYPYQPSPIAEALPAAMEKINNDPNHQTVADQVLHGTHIPNPYHLNGYSTRSNGIIGFKDMLEKAYFDIVTGKNAHIGAVIADHLKEGYLMGRLESMTVNRVYQGLIEQLTPVLSNTRLTPVHRLGALISTLNLLIEAMSKTEKIPVTTKTAGQVKDELTKGEERGAEEAAPIIEDLGAEGLSRLMQIEGPEPFSWKTSNDMPNPVIAQTKTLTGVVQSDGEMGQTRGPGFRRASMLFNAKATDNKGFLTDPKKPYQRGGYLVSYIFHLVLTAHSSADADQKSRFDSLIRKYNELSDQMAIARDENDEAEILRISGRMMGLSKALVEANNTAYQQVGGVSSRIQEFLQPVLTKLNISDRSYARYGAVIVESLPILAYVIYGLASGDWLGTYGVQAVFGLYTMPRWGLFSQIHQWSANNVDTQTFQGRQAMAKGLVMVNSGFFVLATVAQLLGLAPAFAAVVLLGGWLVTHGVANLMTTAKVKSATEVSLEKLLKIRNRAKRPLTIRLRPCS